VSEELGSVSSPGAPLQSAIENRITGDGRNALVLGLHQLSESFRMTSPYSAACPDGLPLCPGCQRRARKAGDKVRPFPAPDRDPSVFTIFGFYTSSSEFHRGATHILLPDHLPRESILRRGRAPGSAPRESRDRTARQSRGSD